MKRIMLDVPDELHQKLELVKAKQMVTGSAIVKLSLNEYCDRVLRSSQ